MKVLGNHRENRIDVVQAKDLSPELFRLKYWSTNTPVLIKGAVKHWPAHTKWQDPAYLISQIGNQEVKVRKVPITQSKVSDVFNHDAGLPHYLLSDFLQSCLDRSTDPIWVGSITLLSKNEFKYNKKIKNIGKFYVELSKLADQDFKEFDFLRGMASARIYPRSRVFLYRNSFTDWHSHPTDSHLLCQIFGSKTILLYSPNKGYQLFKSGYEQLSSEEDKKRHINEAGPISVLVESGDAFHIPIYWHHAVMPAVKSEFGVSLIHAFASPLRLNGDSRFHMSKELYQRAPITLKPILLTARMLAFIQRDMELLVV